MSVCVCMCVCVPNTNRNAHTLPIADSLLTHNDSLQLVLGLVTPKIQSLGLVAIVYNQLKQRGILIGKIAVDTV